MTSRKRLWYVPVLLVIAVLLLVYFFADINIYGVICIANHTYTSAAGTSTLSPPCGSRASAALCSAPRKTPCGSCGPIRGPEAGRFLPNKMKRS